jgi:hypothetical protein
MHVIGSYLITVICFFVSTGIILLLFRKKPATGSA